MHPSVNSKTVRIPFIFVVARKCGFSRYSDVNVLKLYLNAAPNMMKSVVLVLTIAIVKTVILKRICRFMLNSGHDMRG